MNLFDIYKDFIKEVFLLRSYKRMSKVQAVLAAIVVLPFILPFALLMLIYGGILIFHKFLDSPTEYVYAFVKKEGTEVKHATQAVIYFVAFPLIFFLKVLTGILVFFLLVVHFTASIIGYFATLGGVTFSPFLMDPVDRFVPHETAFYGASGGVKVFITLGLILLALVIVVAPIAKEINELVYDSAPERGFKQFCKEVQDNYKNDVIDRATYGDFYDAYTSGAINERNYTIYQSLYKVDRDFVAEAWELYATVNNAIEFVSRVSNIAYVLVVLISTWTVLRTKKLKEGDMEELPVQVPELNS